MQRGVYLYPPMDRVVYGVPFAEALAEEVAARLGANAVYVLASGTLARETDVIDQVRDALGNRLAGVCTNIGAHTPRIDVVAAANEARAVGADALMTVGGGSVTDAAKMVGLCLGNDVIDAGQLDAFRAHDRGRTADGAAADEAAAACARSRCPTTLSAGEFTSFAGCTDTVRHVKESFGHALMMPRAVILDPAATVHTPEWLFLSTGIRAVDHAVEDICSINPQPLSDGTSLHALRLLCARAAGGEARSGRSGGAAGLPVWRMDVDHGIAERRAEGREPRHRPCAGRHRGRAARLHLLRHAAAGAAVQRPVNAERQPWVSEALGRPGMPAADAVRN